MPTIAPTTVMPFSTASTIGNLEVVLRRQGDEDERAAAAKRPVRILRRIPGTHSLHVRPLDPRRLEPLIGAERLEALVATAAALRELLGDRRVLNVNSTATGGGVAEMLATLIGYARGVGIESIGSSSRGTWTSSRLRSACTTASMAHRGTVESSARASERATSGR